MIAQDLVIDIVKKCSGEISTVGGPEIVKAAQSLMGSRKDWGTNALMVFCDSYLKVYHNSNYDSATNGEHRLLKQLAAVKPKVVFDVGANEGQWSLAADKFLQHATIHAFEIVTETARKMAANVEGHGLILTNPFGLADADKTVEVNCYAESTEFSSLMDFPHGLATKVPCAVKRGDGYIEAHGIGHIDFLKVDTEGAEALVMHGFGKYLIDDFIDVIQFEYGSVNERNGFILKNFHDLLHPRGFEIGKLYADGVEFRDYAIAHDTFPGPNYVAVSQKRPDLIERLRAK